MGSDRDSGADLDVIGSFKDLKRSVDPTSGAQRREAHPPDASIPHRAPDGADERTGGAHRSILDGVDREPMGLDHLGEVIQDLVVDGAELANHP